MANSHTHRLGRPVLTRWTPDLVAEANDPVAAFAEYVQQALGVPWPTLADMTRMRRRIKEIFAHYPQADYYTLCRIVAWAKADRRRFGRVPEVVDCFREAFKAGALPELDPPETEVDVEEAIRAVLVNEQDPWWRRRLVATQGVEFRREALEDWRRDHA